MKLSVAAAAVLALSLFHRSPRWRRHQRFGYFRHPHDPALPLHVRMLFWQIGLPRMKFNG
ncbi:hypothetical protein [Labrenzia sp. VG12]|uniref:hypothetical protein n=1 Tax=Labrenzia sp. VG12 TaxID=2021862 RepID=UPI000B8C0CD3|nr:hypothetical protein [Labrenzia sp. VG12]ASP33911.1 hypothetical protein CHH27_12200 [Labrenzia sp. VG12]